MIRYALILAALSHSLAFGQTPPTKPVPSSEPKIVVPERDSLNAIRDKLNQLNAALLPLKDHWHYADVAVYAKAAEWIVRHGEWYGPKAGEQTLAVLDAGLKRAKELAGEAKTPSWMAIRGKPFIRGYVSGIDGSVQPFAMTIPEGYDPKKTDNRLDVVLAGRNATKTEVKFIYARETSKGGKATDRLVVEPYGRGNNAYRWAGEDDVIQAMSAFQYFVSSDKEELLGVLNHDFNRTILRGFSMGGAGTWHLGLHHPKMFAAISPGAGFTVTKGYAKGIPNPLPDYVEKCLRIYDAVDYAENVAVVPVVAYSGEKDPQIAAARNIEERLKEFPDVKPFTHLIAPGLEHKQPPEWLAKIDEELLKHLPQKTGRDTRFVTYTPKYGDAGWVQVFALERQYEKAEVDGKLRGGNPTVTTKNVRVVGFRPTTDTTTKLTIDGQMFDWPKDQLAGVYAIVRRDQGVWRLVDEKSLNEHLRKNPIKSQNLQGPIDDAFMGSFTVVAPEGVPMHNEVAIYSAASMKRFDREWDKWMRGKLPTTGYEEDSHLVLFGDPGCNAKIASILPKLPITWTEEKLIVNGVEYDPKTHVPVLIYPNPENPLKYVVINSGHTFHDADFKGTNALLFPRLGDWAVLKPKPTKDDPAAAEVVAAGLFDENWKFPKK